MLRGLEMSPTALPGGQEAHLGEEAAHVDGACRLFFIPLGALTQGLQCGSGSGKGARERGEIGPWAGAR